MGKLEMCIRDRKCFDRFFLRRLLCSDAGLLYFVSGVYMTMA